MRLLLPLLLPIALVGCTWQELGDGAMNMVEGIGRSACQAASNCESVCPDGSRAGSYTYSCPSASAADRSDRKPRY
ncbi:MAG: hypothetical protein AAFY02_21330 [Pseudomonadota bacterium]